MNIYLAGKIDRQNDWRIELIPNIAHIGKKDTTSAYVDSNHKNIRWEIMPGVVYGHNYTGPYFVHNASTKYGEMHNISIWNHYGNAGNEEIQKYIYTQCRLAIIRSDGVFAYINDHTCYGTIAELGFARGLGKKVGICFETYELACDMWFLRQMVDKEFTEGSVYDCLKDFIEDCGYSVYPKFAGYPTYQEYLQSEHWKELSAKAKQWAGNKCQLCNKDGELHTHHRTYERLGRELAGDLIVLCRDCHAKFHDVE